MARVGLPQGWYKHLTSGVGRVVSEPGDAIDVDR